MPFLKRCTDAYWAPENNDYSLDSPERMRGVLRMVAQEIEAMAPSKTIAKICHLQCMEIAERIRQLGND